ncbi:hypothetical protein NQZ68_032623 [Dissostichus eleginoides]|nr:hypothetical protein NQZ68_032623 [Dissostichus eleginoides]
MSELSSHLCDHNYWRRDPSSSQSSTNRQAARGRKRKGRQSRGPEEPPQRRLREGSSSPQPPTPTPTSTPPQAMLEEVWLDVHPGPLQEPVEGPQPDGATALPLLSEPPGLSPAAFDVVSEMIMAWMSHTPYSREM